MTLAAKVYRCANPAQWHPTLHRVERHHNPPRSWTTDNGASARVVALCGICHNEIHALLNLYVYADGPPPWSSRRYFSLFVRDLAAEAWEQRIPGRTPFTTTEGVRE